MLPQILSFDPNLAENSSDDLSEPTGKPGADDSGPLLAITANFTAEPLKESLQFWSDFHHWNNRIAFAPFDQIFQQLLSAQSILLENTGGQNILLIRFDSWLSNMGVFGTARADENLELLLSCLHGAVGKSSCHYFVCICPSSANLRAIEAASQWIDSAQNRLVSSFAKQPGITVVCAEAIFALYPVEKFDEPHADAIGAIPYTTEFFAALGTYLIRQIYLLRTAPYKVIVLDCDNTLWKGIVGEDGPAKVELTAEYLQLQSFIVRQFEAGMLICLSSKNNEADVWEVFDSRAEMLLQRHHIVAHRINWSPKSLGLRQLAVELNLGLDSFIFLDDSALECAEVRESIPEILTLQVPPEGKSQFLRHVWAFDRRQVNKEDIERTLLYRQNWQREQQRSQSSNFSEFLAALDLQVAIQSLTPARVARVADLTQRTNQFNSTTIRRSERDIDSLLAASDARCLTVDVRDRFGDYGLVGVCIYRIGRAEWVVESFLLSCRALGRGVEYRMLAELGRLAGENKAVHLDVLFKPTLKNQPILEFLESVGSSFRMELPDSTCYRFPVDFAKGVVSLLGRHDGTVKQAEPKNAPVLVAVELVQRAANLARIADDLRTATNVVHHIAARNSRRRGHLHYVAPQGHRENELASIWSKILFLDRVSRYDNFFELGGQSLQAALMLSRLQEMVTAPLRLALLFDNPTLAGFADAVDSMQRDFHTEVCTIPRVAATQAPLSLLQERFWLTDRFVANRAIYNVNARFRIRGSLDIDAFRSAWSAVVERQDALRTIVVEEGKNVVQVVLPTVAGELTYHDLRNHPNDATQRIQQEAELPFDLTQPPLWRSALEQVGENEFVFHWSIHHILMDESSRAVLLHDLWRAYLQIISGGDGHLFPLKLRYVDFSFWQRHRLQDAAIAGELEFWKKRLIGTGVDVLPPHPKARPLQRSYRGGIHRFELPVRLSEQLAEIGRDSAVTPFIVYLAAFQTLLARYTNQTDICVGTAVSNRPAAGCSEILGCFVNTLAIRTELGSLPSFRELLLRVRDVVAEAMQHNDIPIERIIEEVRPERIPGGQPLFQSVFVYQSEDLGDTLPNGLSWHLEPMEHIGAKLDFALAIENGRKAVAVVLEYSLDLYDAESIERIGAHFLTLLDSAAANPEGCILDLAILPATEERMILETWNSKKSLLPAHQCMQELVEEQVARTPEAIAFEFAGNTLTFGDWNRQANQLAHYLREHGVKPDDPVALCLARSQYIPLAMLAVVKAGGAYVPFDPSLPSERLEFMIADTGSPLVLTTRSLQDKLTKISATAVYLDELLPKLAHQDAPNPPCCTTPESLFAIIYTSGSTGKPKGVMLHHRGIVNLMLALKNEWEIGDRDVLIALIPYTFDPHIKEFWGFAIQGARVVIASEDIATDGSKLLGLVNSVHPTVFNVTPTILRLLVEAGWKGTPGLKVLCGGEAITLETVKQILPRVSKFWNVYGPTETSVAALTYPVLDASQAPPVGRPLTNVEIYILDARMHPVPISCAGEIYIGGLGVTHGYFQRPELTQEKFIPNPFAFIKNSSPTLYKTGDLGRYCPNGEIEFLGRIDFQVKIRGFRIELGDIERNLESHPAVQQAVASVRKNSMGVDALVAYFIPREGSKATPAKLRQHLLGKLPEYMVPSAYVAMQKFPETTNRKIDRKALPEPDAQTDAALQRIYVAPINDAERALQPIWEEVFGIRPIGVTENFYDLGGHSLIAALIMSHIETQLGHQVPLESLFQAPTIRGLANVLQRRLELGTGGVLVPLQTQGDHPPLILIAGAGGHVFAFHKFAHLLGPQFNVYGMKAVGVDGTEPPLESVEKIAARYMKEIVEACPDGPYLVGGYSVGGIIAYELGLQLQAAGKKVSRVILFDLFAPGYPKHVPLYKRFYSHIRKFLALPWNGKKSYLRDRIRNIRQRILFKLDKHYEVAEEIAGMDIVPQERLKRVWGGLVKAHQNYWPARVFDGSIVLVSSSLPLNWVGVALDDPLRGWSRWSTHPVKLYQVPAPHMEVFRDEYLDLLVTQVREVLTEAKAEEWK